MDKYEPNIEKSKEVYEYLKRNMKHDRSFIGPYIIISEKPSYFTYSKKIAINKIYNHIESSIGDIDEASIRKGIRDFINYLINFYENS